jgi:hypothetical protein
MCEHEVAEQCSSFGGTRNLLSDDGKIRPTTGPATSAILKAQTRSLAQRDRFWMNQNQPFNHLG